MGRKLRLVALGFFGICLAAVLLGVALYRVEEEVPKAGEIQSGEVLGPVVPPRFRIERTEDVFSRDTTLQDVLFKHSFTPQNIHQLICETRDVYDLNRVAAGHRYAVERFGDGRFRSFEYAVDDETLMAVSYSNDHYVAALLKRDLETRSEKIFGRITRSLWDTLTEAGESAQLIMGIHEVMQWDIDFTTIQPNDSFRLVFDKKYDKEEFVKYGAIQALEFTQSGKSFYAFLFPEEKTGQLKYYDYEGKGVKKAFLKVPFKYDYRISSGFSYSRLHPVSKVRVPHYGIDYAAPSGTPVLASASGRVTFAAWKGGNGNLVTIRHPNGYVTYYLHLSKILVRAGQSVAQGQRIGLVGATGIATGPHLDYRILDNKGKFINPKKWVALPSDHGVTKERMEEFIAVRDAFLRQLESIAEEPDRPLIPPVVAG